MKLVTTLDERPGFLHAIPLFDLFALVTMMLLLGPLFLSQGGISVDVPSSSFQMQRNGDSIVVTLGAGSEESPLYLGRQAVTLEELTAQLASWKLDERMGRAVVLLKTDVRTSVGMERKVSEVILRAGFRLALVGEPGKTGENDDPDAPVSK